MTQKPTHECAVAQSIERGSRLALMAVALNMLGHGHPIEQIAQATGLTVDEVRRLERRKTPRPPKSVAKQPTDTAA